MGDRRFGFLATWAALSSTTIGGSTTIVLAALVASKGLPGLWLDVAGALGLLGLGLFLSRRVRETGALTISEVIGRFYGARVRRIAALFVIAAEIVWFALLAEAAQTVVAAVTPWPPVPVLVVTALLFVTYTAVGGQRAVIGTDLFQFALMVGGLLLVAAPLAVRRLLAHPPARLDFPVSDAFSWTDVLGLLVLVGLPHLVGSDVWAKLLSARDAATARNAALGAAASKLLFGLATAAIALAGLSLGLGGGASLFPKAVFALAGPALAPLLLVALVATMQSSSDSVLLSAAAAATHDVAPSLARHRRLVVVLFGALGLTVALALRDLLETFRLGYTLFASSLILPTLVAFVPRIRVARGMAGAAMVAGGSAALAARLVGWGDPVLAGTAANAAVLLCGLRRKDSLQ